MESLAAPHEVSILAMRHRRMGDFAVPDTRVKVTVAGRRVTTRHYLDCKIARIGSLPKGQLRNEKVTEKQIASVVRAKTAVQNLFAANSEGDGRYFWTGTFAREVVDYAEAGASWRKFVRSMREAHPAFSYVAVPEIQEKRARRYGVKVWHFHAMIWGMVGFAPCEKLPGTKCVDGDERHRLCSSCWRVSCHTRGVWEASNGGGLNIDDCQPVRDSGAVACYVRKYVTKTTFLEVPKGRKVYFAGGKLLARPLEMRYTSIDEVPDEYVTDRAGQTRRDYIKPHIGRIIRREWDND